VRLPHTGGMDTSPAAAPAVTGVADNRGLTLTQLAAERSKTAAQSLRNILPPEDAQLPVCAFGSSI
jgi:hypothetical protein